MRLRIVQHPNNFLIVGAKRAYVSGSGLRGQLNLATLLVGSTVLLSVTATPLGV
jgi:hypothetical protein